MGSGEGVELKPIGIIRTPFSSQDGMPRSTSQAAGAKGTIELFGPFRAGLKDLDGFSHVILLWQLDRSVDFHLLAVPPRQTEPKGVFATRSPHRPNPIGLSVVELHGVEDGVLHVERVDMLDGTPLLDIKPYIPASDSVSNACTGWLGSRGRVDVNDQSA